MPIPIDSETRLVREENVNQIDLKYREIMNINLVL